MKRHCRAHLVTASHDCPETPLREGYRAAEALKLLASAICRRGSYAVTTLRNTDEGDCAMVAIQNREDANRFSEAVGACELPLFGRWLSHSSFVYDARSKARIDEYLAGRPSIARKNCRNCIAAAAPKLA